MPETPYHLVNSFTTHSPYSGSQVAVVLLPAGDARSPDETWLLNTARNFDFPATSFVAPVKAEGEILEFDLRWFTAQEELPLCGHGTLGGARTLFNLFPEAQTIHFNAKAGKITAKRQGSEIEVSLPAVPTSETPVDVQDVAARLENISSIRRKDIVHAAEALWGGGVVCIIEVASDVKLRDSDFDGRALSRLHDTGARQVIFTQMATEQGGSSLSINSRVFLPHATTVEDPATGSAHAALTTYYTNHPSPRSRLPSSISISDFGSFTISAAQLSERGGAMRLRFEQGKVLVKASAIEWGRGYLSI